MGSYPHFYVGPYVEVVLPITTVTKNIISCPNKECSQHGEYVSSKFCALCGSPITNVSIQKEQRISIYDFFEEHLGNTDMFTRASNLNIEDKEIILPNNTEKQGGTYIDEAGVYEIAPEISCPDWDLLFQKLSEQKIEFKKKTGIVYYFY